MNMNVHIDRLVLDGVDFSSHDAAIVRIAVENELVRLIGAHHGPSPIRGSVPSLRGAPMSVGAGAGPAAFGTQVARSVWGGLGEPDGAVR